MLILQDYMSTAFKTFYYYWTWTS